MPISGNITQSADSMQVDTLHSMLDTLNYGADSISIEIVQLAPDTVIAHVLRGFEGIAHVVHPSSADWVFLVLFAQFILLCIVFARSYGWVLGTIASFFKVKERESLFSKSTIIDVQSRFILLFFALSVYSFFIIFALLPPTIDFGFKLYGAIIGVSIVFMLFKYLTSLIIGYVFTAAVDTRNAQKGFADAFNLLAVALYPLLLFSFYSDFGDHHYIRILTAIMLAVAYLLFVIKLFQIFYHKIVTSFYILLYLCTLEIVPLIVLFEVYKIVIKNV